MIARFFTWWLGELRALFAGNPKPREGKTLIFQPGERGTVVSEQRRARMRELGWFAPDGSYSPGLAARLKRFKPGHTGLRFEVLAEEFLEKTLELPAAALENLHEVVRYELERVTPFRQTDVYFDATPSTSGSRDGNINVALRIIQRREIDARIQFLEQSGFSPAQRHTSIYHDDGAVWLSLTPESTRPGLSRRLGPLLWSLNALLVVGLAAWVLWQQQVKLSALDEQSSRLRQELSRNVELFEQVEQRKQQLNALLERQRRRPAAVLILDELTRLMPDNTHLRRLQITGSAVRLQGVSSNAAALVQLIEASNFFSGVRFEAAVVRDTRSQGERFSISAQVNKTAPSGART